MNDYADGLMDGLPTQEQVDAMESIREERDRYKKGIKDAMDMSGNRWSEWGTRAESVADILDDALYPKKVVLRRDCERRAGSGGKDLSCPECHGEGTVR
jgi:hypothetical protein